MNVTGIVANQVLVMYLLIAVGAILSKTKIITEKGAKEISGLLSYVVAPSLIITAYQRDIVESEAHTLIWCFVLAIVTHLVGIGVGALLIRENPKHYPNERHRIARFGAMYANAGFFAYPLLMAVFGKDGIFFGVAYTAVFTLCCWTHGVILITGKADRKQFARLLLNPAILGVLLGLLLYVTGWRLPEQVNTVLDFIGSCNTPLAMIVVGTWFAQADWKSAIRDWTLFLTSGIRLLLIPAIMLGLYMLLPINETILIAAVLPAAAPIGCNTAILPALFGKDRFYGSQLVSVSTIFSIATLPALVWLAQTLFALK